MAIAVECHGTAVHAINRCELVDVSTRHGRGTRTAITSVPLRYAGQSGTVVGRSTCRSTDCCSLPTKTRTTNISGSLYEAKSGSTTGFRIDLRAWNTCQGLDQMPFSQKLPCRSRAVVRGTSGGSSGRQGKCGWTKSSMWWRKEGSSALLGEEQARSQVRRHSANSRSTVTARLFGPAIFEANKLRVLFLNVEEDQHPANDEHPRTYTLTHSDVTAKLTLAVAREFNKAQFTGWYSRLQRDEVLAVWRRAREASTAMALHVHCHISGGHFLLNAIARLRFWIFRKELPVVLEAFRHGDRALFEKHPDLEESPVWVHFHSNIAEFNRRECWGPLANAAKVGAATAQVALKTVIHDIEVAIEVGDQAWPTDIAGHSSSGSLIPRPVFPEDHREGASSKH